MKPVFKCDYCSQMGTEEEIREHEIECINNYDRRSCYTCKYKKIHTSPSIRYECEKGIDIPEGSICEFCNSYERKEYADLIFRNSFNGNPFGGFW